MPIELSIDVTIVTPQIHRDDRRQPFPREQSIRTCDETKLIVKAMKIRIPQLVGRSFEALPITVRNHSPVMSGAPLRIEYGRQSREQRIGERAFIEQMHVRTKVETGRTHQTARVDDVSRRAVPRGGGPVRITKRTPPRQGE